MVSGQLRNILFSSVAVFGFFKLRFLCSNQPQNSEKGEHFVWLTVVKNVYFTQNASTIRENGGNYLLVNFSDEYNQIVRKTSE